MGVLDWLGISKAVPETVKAVSDLYTTDKARMEATKSLIDADQRTDIESIKVNAIFAASERFFKSGFIPMTGWTVGFLILLFYAPQLIVNNWLWAKQCLATGKLVPFPMKPDDIMYLVGLVFGFHAHSIFKKN
jgi:hypothetical protein